MRHSCHGDIISIFPHIPPHPPPPEIHPWLRHCVVDSFFIFGPNCCFELKRVPVILRAVLSDINTRTRYVSGVCIWVGVC